MAPRARGGQHVIPKYVDAIRTLRALEQAETDEGKTEDRTRAINEAKVQVHEYRRLLTGGEIGKAHRILEGREPEVTL